MGVPLRWLRCGRRRWDGRINIDEAGVLAHRIAQGHAFAKHAAQSGIVDRDQFEAMVLETLAAPSEPKGLFAGRAGYWN